MQIEKKYWENYLNGDDADAFILPGEYINMMDFRFGPTSDTGFAKQLEANGSTLLIPNPGLPAGDNICIGGATDWPNRRQIFFMWNTNGDHGIYAYDYLADTIYIVLLNSQVIGGLNFDKEHLIHSARVENGCVYWTDNFNNPRRLNIQAGIALNQPALNDTQIPVNNVAIITGGFLQTTFNLPTNPTPAYGPAVKARLIRVGTGGTSAGATNIDIPLDWSPYPGGQNYGQVLIGGLVAYFTALDPTNTQWHITGSALNPALQVSLTWDWATGDPLFAPIVSTTLELFTEAVVPYVSQVNQSVITWIRRPPGLAPTQTKVTQTVPAISTNFIKNEALEFCYRYVYRGFEISTLSGLSNLASFNADADTFNRIDISIPLAEKIDQEVYQVDLVARYLVSGIYFIIKSWVKNNQADIAAIAAHNAGTTPLTYSFYNDAVGIALDSPYSVKPFDSVPLLAQTIEMAKNRGFMGNYTIGYNSPTSTSLVISSSLTQFTPNQLSTITGEWFLLKWTQFFFTPYSYYILQTTFPLGLIEAPAPVYYYSIATPVPPFPLTLTAGSTTFLGSTMPAVIYTLQTQHSLDHAIVTSQTLTDQGSSTAITIPVSSSSILAKAFKSDASYQVAITFYDNYGRKCGVVTNSSLLTLIPDTGLSADQYVTMINWVLSNANAAGEIPDWAYYYSVDITQCLRTRFFLQMIGVLMYAKKDASNNYTFTTLAYSSDLAGIAVDISFFASYGMGYVFAPGDIIKIFYSGTEYTLSIIGQVAQYIICELKDFGTFPSGALGIFEIYTPYQRQAGEPYFEVGQIFAVSNPTTTARQYSITTGTIGGDIWLVSRKNSTSTFITEAMSPNDKFYTQWYTDAGRPNFIDHIGQVVREDSIAFSNTFIAGTQNNGLSTFDALDTSDISADFGPIMKLQLASKVEKIGTIMLAICAGSETASIYLSENTLISNTGEAFVAQANAVIGSIHQLKGEFGTLNPESVFEYRGNIYWWDIQNGKVIQYADNGLFPITNYKLNRFAKLFSDQFKSMTAADIEALGNRPFIFGGIDPHHGEVLFSLPKTLAVPPRGYLPDYPATPFPFDIWDGRGKSVVYKLYADPNKWQGAYSFVPEFMFYLEDNLFSFRDGNLYRHNQTTSYCNYYGVQYQPAVMFLSNQLLNKPKVYNNISVEGSAAPVFTYLMSLYPWLQSTDLIASDYSVKEGVFYATIYRNKLDPAFNNYPGALIAGEKMRTAALYCMLQFDATSGIVQVKFANVGFTVSLGQKV